MSDDFSDSAEAPEEGTGSGQAQKQSGQQWPSDWTKDPRFQHLQSRQDQTFNQIAGQVQGLEGTLKGALDKFEEQSQLTQQFLMQLASGEANPEDFLEAARQSQYQSEIKRREDLIAQQAQQLERYQRDEQMIASGRTYHEDMGRSFGVLDDPRYHRALASYNGSDEHNRLLEGLRMSIGQEKLGMQPQQQQARQGEEPMQRPQHDNTVLPSEGSHAKLPDSSKLRERIKEYREKRAQAALTGRREPLLALRDEYSDIIDLVDDPQYAD